MDDINRARRILYWAIGVFVLLNLVNDLSNIWLVDNIAKKIFPIIFFGAALYFSARMFVKQEIPFIPATRSIKGVPARIITLFWILIFSFLLLFTVFSQEAGERRLSNMLPYIGIS